MHLPRLIPAVVLMTAVLAACTEPRDPAAQIDIRPSPAVRFATGRVSPAVVQLDVVTENFVNGQSRPSRSIGSGVIIDKAGHILTNFHVAGRAKRIDITLANQEHVRASLIGSDHWTDLALVQLDMAELKRRGLTFDVATLGSSSEVMLGQPVMAVGTPYGLSRTVTAGIISQTDRAFDQTNIDGYETGWFNNWIQTDAAINPGNSGGPLIDMRGAVIGINTRGISEGNNLGFAIPIDTAKEVAKDLLAHKKVTRSYIGLTLQPMQDLEKYYDIPGNRGVLVSSVEKDSPAEKAGLKAEDILLAVDGKPVNARFPEQLAAVRKLISDYPVGAKINLTVQHGTGALKSATASAPATGTAPVATTRAEPIPVSVVTEKLESVITEEKSIAAWGLTVRDLTRAYLREQRLPYTQGVLVTGTRAGGPAAAAKISGGDIILAVSDPADTSKSRKVTSSEELEAIVTEWSEHPQQAKAGIGVDISRDRGQITLVVKP